jgi:hypothetical protein
MMSSSREMVLMAPLTTTHLFIATTMDGTTSEADLRLCSTGDFFYLDLILRASLLVFCILFLQNAFPGEEDVLLSPPP